MQWRQWAKVALFVPLLLAGCKGFWDEPSSSGSGGSTTATSGYFYVLNAETSEIAAYYVNAGTLTAVNGSPYTAPATPVAITVAPNNSFLYVSTIGGIYLYTIASDGELTLSNSSSPISTDQAASMQVSASSNWLVEAVSGIADVYAIPINSSTGLLRSTTEQYATISASTVNQVAIAPDDSYVLVAMGTGGTAVIPFSPNNANPLGSASTISPESSSGGALSVAVDPSSRLFYIGETAAVSGTNTGGVRAFKLSTLAEISGSPFASGGLAPYWILPETNGSYVYVLNRQTASSSTGVIKGFTLTSDSSTYTLTAMSSTFTVGTHPVAMVEDNTQQFIFAVDFGGNPDLIGYIFDSTTDGALEQVISSSTGTDPVQATAIAALH